MTIKNPAPYKNLQRPFTRKSRVKSKGYVKTVPPSHLLKYTMGNSNKFNMGEFPIIVHVVSKEDAQIRDVALESIRNHLHREIELQIGMDYYMRVNASPHQILREHKQAAVAQADRISSGMSLSFGKCVGRAARVHIGQDVLVFGFMNDEAVRILRNIYSNAKSKLNILTTIQVEKVALK